MIVLTQLGGAGAGSEFWFLVIQEIPEPPQKKNEGEKKRFINLT